MDSPEELSTSSAPGPVPGSVVQCNECGKVMAKTSLTRHKLQQHGIKAKRKWNRVPPPSTSGCMDTLNNAYDEQLSTDSAVDESECSVCGEVMPTDHLANHNWRQHGMRAARKRVRPPSTSVPSASHSPSNPSDNIQPRGLKRSTGNPEVPCGTTLSLDKEQPVVESSHRFTCNECGKCILRCNLAKHRLNEHGIKTRIFRIQTPIKEPVDSEEETFEIIEIEPPSEP